MAWKALSSGVLTSSGAVFAEPCFYFGFTCKNEGSAFTVKIYDNASAASGTQVEDYITDVNKEMEGHQINSPIVCRNGLYLDLGGGSAIVYYSPLREGVQ